MFLQSCRKPQIGLLVLFYPLTVKKKFVFCRSSQFPPRALRFWSRDVIRHGCWTITIHERSESSTSASNSSDYWGRYVRRLFTTIFWYSTLANWASGEKQLNCLLNFDVYIPCIGRPVSYCLIYCKPCAFERYQLYRRFNFKGLKYRLKEQSFITALQIFLLQFYK